MTKKDYILIADCIAKANTKYDVTDYLVIALKLDNPLFNADRFYLACGVSQLRIVKLACGCEGTNCNIHQMLVDTKRYDRLHGTYKGHVIAK